MQYQGDTRIRTWANSLLYVLERVVISFQVKWKWIKVKIWHAWGLKVDGNYKMTTKRFPTYYLLNQRKISKKQLRNIFKDKFEIDIFKIDFDLKPATRTHEKCIAVNMEDVSKNVQPCDFIGPRIQFCYNFLLKNIICDRNYDSS